MLVPAIMIAMCGLLSLIFAVLYFCGKKLGHLAVMPKDVRRTFDVKKYTRFCGFTHLLSAFMFLVGALLIYLELFPRFGAIMALPPVLLLAFGLAYVNASRRFRTAESNQMFED